MLTTIAQFSFPHEALIAKASLEAENIPVFLMDEYTINANWLYSNAWGGVRLQVPEAFVTQARDILNTDFSADVEAQETSEKMICTHCGSTEGAWERQGQIPAYLTWIFLDVPLFLVKNVWRCKVCKSIQK